MPEATRGPEPGSPVQALQDAAGPARAATQWSTIRSLPIGGAGSDPFSVGREPPPNTSPAPGPTAAAAPVPPPPATPSISAVPIAAPSQPPLIYTYFGRLTAPDGSSRVFLTAGDKHHEVVAGTRLPDGFIVEAVTERAIAIQWPGSEQRAEIPIPPPVESAR